MDSSFEDAANLKIYTKNIGKTAIHLLILEDVDPITDGE